MKTTLLAAAVSLVLVVGCQKNGTHPVAESGHPSGYPEPKTTYQGRTAKEWGVRAKDTDPNTCYDAARALNNLGEEGIPFLLEALDSQKNPENISACLMAVNGQFVLDKDLARILPFLDEKYARYDSGAMMIRYPALSVFCKAGPRAKPYLEQVRAFQNDPNLGDISRRTMVAIHGEKTANP